MVTQTQEPEAQPAPEAVTTAPEAPVATEEPSSPFATAEQLAAIAGSITSLVKEVRGLQRRQDKDLAAVRRDIGRDFQDRLGKMEQATAEKGIQDRMAAIPEEVRPWLEPLYREIATLKAQPHAPAEAVEAEWQRQAKDYVRELGLDPEAAGIDYSLLNKGQASARDMAQFTTHVLSLGAKPTESRATPASTPTQRTPTPSPPVVGGPQRGSGFTTKDQVLQALVEKRIPTERAQEEYMRVSGGQRIPGT